ncbi:MAG: BatD family protein [Betaproteobacteria bacterium]
MLISKQRPWHHHRLATGVLAKAMLALLVLSHNADSGAAVQAYLQRDTIANGESVTLHIESDQAHSGLQPDLAPLNKDFDVLGTSTSSQTQIVNGKRSEKTSWLVQLQPRHGGTLEIPPISVGNEQTGAVAVTVHEPSAQARQEVAQHLFLESDNAAGGKSVYVQQQIPYTVRLYFDDTIQSGELSPPTSADAVIEQLGEDTRYKSMRNGHAYNVIERRYAIAPEKSGTLHIAPAGFRGTVLAADDPSASASAGNNPFAEMLRNTPFANDPAFMRSFGAGLPFGNAGQPVAVRGQELTLQIQPRPAQAKGNWLPAQQITLHDSWQDQAPQFRVGEPVTRTITIEAKGLAASQIPTLALSPPVGARLYPEAPQNQSRTDGKTIYGISKQDVTYIPDAQGALQVAPVELAWWNTTTDMQSQATLPALAFQVAPGAMPAPSNVSPVAGNPATPTATVAAGTTHSWRERIVDTGRWTVAASALLSAIVAGLLWLWLRVRRLAPKPQHPAGAPEPMRKRSVLRGLRQACTNHQPHAAAQALLALARIEWPASPPRSLGALASRLEAGAAQVHALDRHLYGADAAAPWHGDALWQALGRGLQPRKEPVHSADDALQALYRP